MTRSMPSHTALPSVITLVAVAAVGGTALSTTATQGRGADDAPTPTVAAAQQTSTLEGQDCPQDPTALDLPGEPTACMHPAEAPPGVDVTDYVSTSELRTRTDVAANATAAAEAMGVSAADDVDISTPKVQCDGNGTTGFRTQAVYVYVTDSQPGQVGADRYAQRSSR